jgi:hypothetical protein
MTVVQPKAETNVFEQLRESIAADQGVVAEVDLAVSEIAEALGTELAGNGHVATKPHRPTGSRPKNAESVKELIVKVTSDEPMSKGEIAVALIKEGYKTTSTDNEAFLASVYSNGIAPLVKEKVLEAVGERGNHKYVKRNYRKKK